MILREGNISGWNTSVQVIVRTQASPARWDWTHRGWTSLTESGCCWTNVPSPKVSVCGPDFLLPLWYFLRFLSRCVVKWQSACSVWPDKPVPSEYVCVCVCVCEHTRSKLTSQPPAGLVTSRGRCSCSSSVGMKTIARGCDGRGVTCTCKEKNPSREWTRLCSWLMISSIGCTQGSVLMKAILLLCY